MTARAVFVLANAIAWAVLIGLRAPLPASYFDDHDAARRAGGLFYLNSADPPLVVAGRPLHAWSVYHGGEAIMVKALEVANLIPLLGTMIASTTVVASLQIPMMEQSYVTCGILLMLTTIQWWTIGSVVASFRRWRLEQHAQGGA
jgi:hypothetical protein